MWLLILFAFLAFFALYSKFIKPLKFWKEKGVPYLTPWPLVGNMAPHTFRKTAFVELINNCYKAYPDARYVGLYQYLHPVLMIRDPNLIKQITVKDFDSFPNRKPIGSKESDPLWSRNLNQLTAQNGWHEMRATLSPAFTSSKMKSMFILIKQCAEQLINYFPQQTDTINVELRDIFTKFTIDVIASTAFGVNCNSLANPENEFYIKGKQTTNLSGFKTLRFFGHSISPTLMKLFKVTMFDKEITDFFRRIVKETLQVREEKQIKRPDILHMLMEARKGRLKYDDRSNVIDTGFAVVEESLIGRTQKKLKSDLTDDDITAQAILFFAAGYHTSSTTMCYISHELAMNSDIQRKLHNEIDATLRDCKGSITYEALLAMKYLDFVLSETLRKWPPAIAPNRITDGSYVIEPTQSGEKAIHLEAGTCVWIPIFSIHRDPKYYPNPEKFDPERFNDQNKHKIQPYTYLPFGAGPRNCIGSRFALMEIKLLVVEFYRKFEIFPIEKTQTTIEFSKKVMNPVPDAGFWFGLKPRTTLE